MLTITNINFKQKSIDKVECAGNVKDLQMSMVRNTLCVNVIYNEGETNTTEYKKPNKEDTIEEVNMNLFDMETENTQQEQVNISCKVEEQEEEEEVKEDEEEEEEVKEEEEEVNIYDWNIYNLKMSKKMFSDSNVNSDISVKEEEVKEEQQEEQHEEIKEEVKEEQQEEQHEEVKQEEQEEEEPKMTIDELKQLLNDSIDKKNTSLSYYRTIKQVYDYFRIDNIYSLLQKEQDIIDFIEDKYKTSLSSITSKLCGVLKCYTVLNMESKLLKDRIQHYKTLLKVKQEADKEKVMDKKTIEEGEEILEHCKNEMDKLGEKVKSDITLLNT